MTATSKHGLPAVWHDRPRDGTMGNLLGDTLAKQMLTAAHYTTAGIQPLPPGTPGRITGDKLGIADSSVFGIIGDHGGVKDALPQGAVAKALAAEKLGFIYSVGDVVYFNGDPSEYGPQFYEPYAHVPFPFVAVPGNHDGDPSDGVSGSGIGSFMTNFCASEAGRPPSDPGDEFGRHTQTQPYCDWTLELPNLTIIGVWTNVPSGGHFFQSQIDWLVAELKAAPTDRPVWISGHHPAFSIDSHHGGSQKVAAVYDEVYAAAGRFPQVVLAGHVHDTQFFTYHPAAAPHPILHVVCGNSGYHHLHAISADYTPGMQVASDMTCDYADASEYGYIKASVSGMTSSFEYVGVTPGASANLPPQITPRKYACTVRG